MKNIIQKFLSVLLAGFLYWGLIQYTDTGAIELAKLFLTPEPWFLAIFFTTVMFLWRKFKPVEKHQENKGEIDIWSDFPFKRFIFKSFGTIREKKMPDCFLLTLRPVLSQCFYIWFNCFSETLELIKNYLEKTRSYTPARFIIESSLIALLGKVLVGFLIGIFIVLMEDGTSSNDLSMPAYLETLSPALLFFLLCIFAPVTETIVMQWLPVKLLQKVTSNTGFILWIDAIIFTSAHWWNYGFIQIFAILPAGIVLAWSFILNNEDSLLKAFGITASIHALYNFISFLPIAFL